jgi:hypothetical protein
MTVIEQMQYVLESHLRERKRLGSGEVIAITLHSFLDDESCLETEWSRGTVIHSLDKETV